MSSKIVIVVETKVLGESYVLVYGMLVKLLVVVPTMSEIAALVAAACWLLCCCCCWQKDAKKEHQKHS